MDPFYSYRSGAGAASASAGYGGYSSSSYRLQPQHSLPRESYGLDRWSSLPLPAGDLPPYSAYPRGALDPRLDRVGSFAREALPPRGYSRPAQDFRPRRRAADVRPAKKKPLPAQSLGPKKKAFKQTQEVKAAPKKPVGGGKKEAKVEVKEGKDKSSAAAMAKEIKELHSLWRTGVDLTPAKKRKIEDEKQEESKGKKEDGKASNEDMKKAKRKRKRGVAKQKKWVKKDDGKSEDGGAEDGQTPLSDEEKQALLDLQREAGKNAREFLGLPPDGEAADTEVLTEAGLEGEGEKKTDEITDEKVEELTPEEVKANEEKAFEYFSKLLEEDQELRKLYAEKCNNGTFECVVCCAIGVKFIKKFRNLVSLVMHASKIQKSKKLPEHRGYGRAVCSALGWDPLKLPPLPRGRGPRPADGATTKEKKDMEKSEVVGDTKVENGDGPAVVVVASDEIKTTVDEEMKDKDSTAEEAAVA